jgi:hypothetical protein
MSLTLPTGRDVISQMMSPYVSNVSEGSCLSFLIHFNSSSFIKITIGTVNNDSLPLQFEELGALLYPFNQSVYSEGDSSQFFRIHLPLVTGTYRLAFVAEGSNGGSVDIWDVKHTSGGQCVASRGLYYYKLM